MRREKLEHLVTIGMIGEQCSRGQHVGWTIKVAKARGVEMRGRS